MCLEWKEKRLCCKCCKCMGERWLGFLVFVGVVFSTLVILRVCVIQKTTFSFCSSERDAFFFYFVFLSHISNDRASYSFSRSPKHPTACTRVYSTIFFPRFYLVFFWSCTVFRRHKSNTCNLHLWTATYVKKKMNSNNNTTIERRECFCAFACLHRNKSVSVRYVNICEIVYSVPAHKRLLTN